MEKYDVFKSQGGYGVAMGVYLDCPVVGSIRWFETESQANEYSKNKKVYDKAYTEWEEKIVYMSLEEIKKSKIPKEKDYNLNVGITI